MVVVVLVHVVVDVMMLLEVPVFRRLSATLSRESCSLSRTESMQARLAVLFGAFLTLSPVPFMLNYAHYYTMQLMFTVQDSKVGGMKR